MDPEDEIIADLDRFGRMLTRMESAAERNERTIEDVMGPKGPIQSNAKAIAELTAKQNVQWWAIGLLIVANIVKAFL